MGSTTDTLAVTTGELIPTGGFNLIAGQKSPDQVLAEAKHAALALKGVLDQKPDKVMMGGSQYLEFEDWQTVGAFFGIFPRLQRTEFVQFGDVSGFEATVDAVHAASGHVIASGDAMCLNDEEKWSTRPKYEYVWDDAQKKKVKTHTGDVPVPLFQLRSMAQTRASAKALRACLAWVVVLAGYKATPAEELEGVGEGTTRTPNDGKLRVTGVERVETQSGKVYWLIALSSGVKAHTWDDKVSLVAQEAAHTRQPIRIKEEQTDFRRAPVRITAMIFDQPKANGGNGGNGKQHEREPGQEG